MKKGDATELDRISRCYQLYCVGWSKDIGNCDEITIHLSRMRWYLHIFSEFIGQYFMTAFFCYIVSVPILTASYKLLGILHIDIELVTASSYLFFFWGIPPFFVALLYSLFATPLALWLERKEIYEKYRMYILRYALFFPFYIVVAGVFCMENQCYI